MDYILTAEHITKTFATHRALDDVSIAVPRGSVYGLLGPNGAGKTTLIRIINHITGPDSGTVTFEGTPLRAESVRNIGYLPEERGLYKKMKVGEQALFFARLKGLDRKTAERELKLWFDKFDIMPWWNKKVEELSKGMAQKVQFIVTVLHHPSLLIFDEPFSGFDPINANLLKNEILALRDQGATIIFSTHNMASVEEICDQITLINKSHNILTGPVAQLREQYGNNTYDFSYIGDPTVLEAAMASMGAAVTHKGPNRLGETTASVRLNSADDARRMIELANQAVNVRSLNRYLPSMDDIFIQTVQANNAVRSQSVEPDNIPE